MRQAPDFWAFVNQTIELPDVASAAEQPSPTQAVARNEQMWLDNLAQLSPAERQARIDLHERLLAELSPDETTSSSRAKLHYGFRKSALCR